MRYILLVFLVVGASVSLIGQEVKSIDIDDLKNHLEVKNDTTYVINFWATWCSPCVNEIGFFEDVHRNIQDDKLKIILISLDFPNQLESRVKPFILDHELTARVDLMTEMDYNKWIPLVDPEWSGAIPATLIFKGEERSFHPHELSLDELESAISEILHN